MSSLIAVRPAVGMLAPIVFGVVADAFHLRSALVRIGCLCSSLVFALIWFRAAHGGTSFVFLFAMLTLFAFFRTPMTTIADVTALEGKASFGTVRLWGSIGFMVAAWLCGKLLDVGSSTQFPLAMTCALALAFAASLLLPGRVVKPPEPFWHDARRLLVAADFRWLLLAAVLWQLAHASYDLCVSLHFRDLGASSSYIGGAWALGTLAEVAIMALSERLVLRHGPLRLLVAGFAVAAARWLLLSQVRSLSGLLLLQPLHALSFALPWLAALAWVKQRARAGVLGTAQGLFNAAVGTGACIGFVTWGPMYQRYGGSFVFACAAVVAAASSGAMLLVRSRSAPELASA
jgi:PPP family 3-phenylpropionic acid transporter